MPVFQDVNGLAVKFFIQKDLPQDVQAELCETITSLGGRIEAKVPRQGYVLVQPGTAEEERLRLCWTSSDRPDRFFVPYTYVEACKIAGMLLKQIFVENGVPITMHIHPSITNTNARTALAHRIMHSGGDPNASLQSARIILADPHSDVFQHLVKMYQDVPDKYIESYLWVKKCIERGSVVYTPMVYKNPGGRRPGEERMQFTDDDEQRLCNWIATKIPYKETGGRTGNRLYQQLCDLAGEPEYAWVSRHTWQSWRERYKKNAERLDKIIITIVEQKKPQPGEKGQYGYVRQPEDPPKRSRKRKIQVAEEVPQADRPIHGIIGIPVVAGPSHVHAPTVVPGMNVTTLDPTITPLHELDNPFSVVIPPTPNANTIEDPIMTKSPIQEELEDEWAVRIGDAPPPLWSKKSSLDEEVAGIRHKRTRISEPTTSTPEIHDNQAEAEHPSLSPTDLLTIAKLHVVDLEISDIAKEFRFTVEEVNEYHAKCADMLKTRSRFQRMREELNRRFADDLQ